MFKNRKYQRRNVHNLQLGSCKKTGKTIKIDKIRYINKIIGARSVNRNIRKSYWKVNITITVHCVHCAHKTGTGEEIIRKTKHKRYVYT